MISTQRKLPKRNRAKTRTSRPWHKINRRKSDNKRRKSSKELSNDEDKKIQITKI